MAVPGTMGKIASVSLSNGTVQIEQPDDELYLRYLGGYGLGAHYLYTRMEAGADPLGPANLLGFFAGPLTGTPAICGNRFQVVAKSPKTGGFGDANCGGNFGPYLKFAGLDGVLIGGVSEEPVYLVLANGQVEVKSAADLWGLAVDETEAKLKEIYGSDTAIASIGPMGEAMNLLACIMNDRDRAAGRSGLGAVMGSKKLKAIVACKTTEIPLADEARMKAERAQHIATMKDESSPFNGLYGLFSTFGTSGLTAGAVAAGDCPVKNWSGTVEDFGTAAKISDEAVKDIQYKRYGCWHCPLSCGGFVKTQYKGEEIDAGKPEYETLGAFGAMLLVDDLAAICKANDLCNLNGIDTISTGCTVAFAYECYEKGIITTEETGGLELTWGNAEAMVALVEQIIAREGFGAVLADGAKVAAERIGNGAEDCAMQIGGTEIPMHDPRLCPGIATSYRLDATPGRHTQFSAWAAEAGFPVVGLEDRYAGWTPEAKYDYTGKAKAHRIQSALMHVINAEGCCMFGSVCLPASGQVDFLNGAMGA
ncbi:aldehyde ferredoxin oxidoreductase, partial [bacterium]|nr:aldehyde ferredoxin oxidoreductase [bacterium]